MSCEPRAASKSDSARSSRLTAHSFPQKIITPITGCSLTLSKRIAYDRQPQYPHLR